MYLGKSFNVALFKSFNDKSPSSKAICPKLSLATVYHLLINFVKYELIYKSFLRILKLLMEASTSHNMTFDTYTF